jgi:3-hydroxybutyryl-CoA dehydrogenase
MKIKNLTVAGAGTLGSQIAFQTALCGFPVNIWNPHPERAKQRLEALRPLYHHDLNLTDEEFDKALSNIKMITNEWDKPFAGADYIIEAVPEKLAVKEDFYHHLEQYVTDETIIASNSSTFMPSQLVKYVKNPSHFLHMHFANHIWQFNTAEIVGTKQTDPAVIQAVVDFARDIKMMPVVLHKENPGYLMNAMLIPLLSSAQYLWASGVADYQTIDKDWMNSTGAPIGPFMILDMVGLRTAYAISAARAKDNPASKIIADKLGKMVEAGHTGQLAGQGFYKYPHPEFEDPDFLK